MELKKSYKGFIFWLLGYLLACFGPIPFLPEWAEENVMVRYIMNITNISGEAITGNVIIYYKNSFNNMLYGGITYRVTISGGMRAGEIKQISASHFSASDSRVMFVTVG